ncbi:MAG: substrate-binding domain-containing protein [Lachnospiraceae bacterium]|nr:substrate-binding domain-containing protein [Lachnospiraceae bacterium]
MKRKNILESRRALKRLCFLFGLLMIAVFLASMVYFRYKIRESAELVDSLEYNTYDKYYVIIADDKKNSFWQSVHEGAAKEASGSGAFVEMFGENLSVDYSKEDLMKIAVDAKVDGIIVEADESAKMQECIRQAKEAGIPVVTALSDNPESLRQSYVGVNNYNLGREYGNQICQIAKEKGQGAYRVLVLLDADKEGSSQNIVISAIQEMIQSGDVSGTVSLETAQIESGSMFAAEESIRDIFMQSEQLPDIIVCLNEQNTTCVYQTVVDYNKVGQVEIVGYYESPTILSAIKKDIIHATISIDAKQMGTYCVEALNEYIENGRVSDYYDVDASLINAETLAASGEGGADEENK